MLLSPIHCCDVTKPPYLLSGELCTSPLYSNRLFVYTVCCRRGGQCVSVLRTRHTDVVGEVTSPTSDTMCHFCASVDYTVRDNEKKICISRFILQGRNINFKNILRVRCSLRKIRQNFTLIFWSETRGDAVKNAMGSL